MAALGAALVAIVAYKYAHDRNARGGWRIGTTTHPAKNIWFRIFPAERSQENVLYTDGAVTSFAVE